jgi:molybdopterin-guanine dinucleotide biosynthesis protein A
MGTDKALLPHPDGATWLERTLLLLAELEAPITLLSRWPEHLDLARHLAVPQLEPFLEPAPHEGPLLALQRLMEHQPNHALLLCPVDMPGLSREAVAALLHSAKADPGAIHLAHDGQHLQPLLGVYPSDASRRSSLTAAVNQGERSLQRWLSNETWRRVSLDPQAIRNVNDADELEQLATA